MISEHVEIEAKLEATHVSLSEFKDFVLSAYTIESYKHILGPDDYYESGDHVVRHRRDRVDHHELTVKRRKSESSTRDRLEVDLHFAKETKPEDVAAFLGATGFKKTMTVVKSADIFWIRLTPSLNTTLVIYDVWLEDAGGLVPGSQKRFIEVEAEKGSNCTHETAKRHIRSQVKLLQERFRLGEPLNESLWELYSGRRYLSL